MSLEGLDFLNCCLQHNPEERMDWDELLKHNYLHYDYTKYMGDAMAVNQSELMLSYNEDSGVYSAIMKNNPQYQLNSQNAILFNTKNPQYFQQTYERTLMKKYADQVKEHAQEQLNVIEQKNQELGQSSLLDNWDRDFPDPIVEEDSRPFLNNMIIEVEAQQKKKKKVLSPEQQQMEEVRLDEDEDKAGDIPLTDLEMQNPYGAQLFPEQSSNQTLFTEGDTSGMNFHSINKMSQQLKEQLQLDNKASKDSQVSGSSIQNVVVKMFVNEQEQPHKPEKPELSDLKNDFEEIKKSEI